MNFIEGACQQIVSPPKFRYSSLDLGPILLMHGRRHDFLTINKFQKTLKCSLYIPKAVHNSQITVLYLHSMNGSRLECLSYIQTILEMGLYFCSFDFAGCGNSEGDKISFGANEKYDIDTVAEHIFNKFGMNRFILWGRSMGAVAALKYQQLLTHKFSSVEIHGLVLDSPFRSLKELIIELGTQRTEFPKIFIQAGFHLIKKTLQKKGEFNIEELELIQTIKRINEVSIIFFCSKNDTTIDASHSQNLYEEYPYRDKRLVYFNGLHNESRDQQYLNSIRQYIQERVSKADQRKVYTKYKRIRLEQEVIKRTTSEMGGISSDCECRFFPFKSKKGQII